jgi:transposase-like protein
MTLTEFLERFPTEDSCREYLAARRWHCGARCPRCGNQRVHRLTRPFSWACKACGPTVYRFSPLVGTVFENTKVGLRTWFQVIYLMCTSQKGLNAREVQRKMCLGSYETAWYMCHRIRAVMMRPRAQEVVPGNTPTRKRGQPMKPKERLRPVSLFPLDFDRAIDRILRGGSP